MQKFSDTSVKLHKILYQKFNYSKVAGKTPQSFFMLWLHASMAYFDMRERERNKWTTLPLSNQEETNTNFSHHSVHLPGLRTPSYLNYSHWLRQPLAPAEKRPALRRPIFLAISLWWVAVFEQAGCTQICLAALQKDPESKMHNFC